MKLIGAGVLSAATAAVSLGVQAQEAASISLGDTELTPEVRVDYLSIDNLYRKGVDPESGSAVLINPSVTWQAESSSLLLEAQYDGNYGLYSEDGLDYDNHYLGLRSLAQISSRQRLGFTLAASQRSVEQGLGQTSSIVEILDEQIEIDSVAATGTFTYGAVNARGNLQGGLSVGSVDYSNLEQITEGDSYTYVRPFGIFSLRVSPDTRLQTIVRYAVLDYDDDGRDRDQVSLLAGVTMSASSKLSGDARVGVVKASFDQSSDEDTTELIAEVGLDYAPVSYSRFRLDLTRGLETEDNSGDNVGQSVDDDLALVWTHDWSSRFQTQSTFSFSNEDRECPNIDDQTVGVEVELNFQVRRWLQFGISGAQASRTIDVCDGTSVDIDNLEYDRSVFGAHIRATL